MSWTLDIFRAIGDLLRSASFCFAPAAQATPLRSRKVERRLPQKLVR